MLFRASYRFSRNPKGKICPKKRKKRFEREPGQQSLFDVLKRKAKESTGEENEENEDKEAIVTTKMMTQQKKKTTMPLKVKKK